MSDRNLGTVIIRVSQPPNCARCPPATIRTDHCQLETNQSALRPPYFIHSSTMPTSPSNCICVWCTAIGVFSRDWLKHSSADHACFRSGPYILYTRPLRLSTLGSVCVLSQQSWNPPRFHYSMRKASRQGTNVFSSRLCTSPTVNAAVVHARLPISRSSCSPG